MSYTAIVLTEDSREKLLQHLEGKIPDGWKIIAHHLTIHMGPPKEYMKKWLGSFVSMTVDELAKNDKVMAVKVSLWEPTPVPERRTPHITIAVNSKEGGKPVMSRKLQDWEKIEPIILRGQVQGVS